MILSFSCLTSQPIDEVGIGRYICIKYNVINHEEKDKNYQKQTEETKVIKSGQKTSRRKDF